MGKNKAKQHQATKFEDHVGKITKRSILKTTSLKPIKKVQFAVSEATQEKKNLFALDSDEEQEDLKQWKLTHRGKDLNDDYNDQIDDAESDEDLPKGFVKDNHFVGFDQKISKSKKDIYDDIIRNSKMKKSEKLKTKEENQERIEKLNEVLPVVLELLPLKKKNAPLDQSYLSLYQEFKMQPKTQVEVIERTGDLSQPSLAKQYRDKRRQQKEAGSDDEEFPNKRTDMQLSDSDDESQNDDMVNKVVKSTKEKKMLKSYKKVEHLNNMMDHLRKVQERKKNQQLGEGEEDEEIDELDELEMSGDEDEDGDEFDEEEGDEEEGDEEEGEEGDDDEDEEEGDNSEDDEDDEESVEEPVKHKVNAKQQNKKSR